METICGAKCDACLFKAKCGGCKATGGRPFGKACVAAQYITAGGKEAYEAFKARLLCEINALLSAHDLPTAAALFELPGESVNLAYPLPSGEAVRLLDDQKIYLGTQAALPVPGLFCGAVADPTFILVSTYSTDGASPELIAYQKR